MRRRRAVAALVLFAAGCGEGSAAVPPPRLLVLAAASTTEVVTRLAADFQAATVQTSFGGSGALARQIEDGAPADLFVSASRRWVDELARRHLLLAAPRVLCRNQLVCVAGPGSALVQSPPADAGALAVRLPADARLAIADAGVPAGDYARQSLQATGALAALTPHLVAMTDVRAVLRAVAAGEVAAGFVYATDAGAAAVTPLFAFDPATHAPIEYLVAIPSTSREPGLAEALLDHLTGAAAAAVLTAAGFVVPGR